MSTWVLLVDDNPDDRDLLADGWRRSGDVPRLECSIDGVDALAHLQEALESGRSAPKVVLVDLKMPRMDGFELLRNLRAEAATRRLPVVVLSSSGEPTDIERSYVLGANGFVTKPSSALTYRAFAASVAEYWVRFNQAPESGTP